MATANIDESPSLLLERNIAYFKDTLLQIQCHNFNWEYEKVPRVVASMLIGDLKRILKCAVFLKENRILLLTEELDLSSRFELVWMNKSKSCIPYVCTGSGHKWVSKRHDIGAQFRATATNIAGQKTETLIPQIISKISKIIQKLLRQLEVVPSTAAEGQNNPDGYQVAVFVPSKVPRWRTPPFLNIHHPRTSHHPSHDQGECYGQAQHCAWFSSKWKLGNFLTFELFKWKCEEKWKLTLEEFLTLKVKKVIFNSKCCFSGNCDF